MSPQDRRPDVVVGREPADARDAAALVAELESHLAERYPAESRHGYSVERLLEAEVAFFVARIDGAAAGCGGVQLVGQEFAEVKRMWVRPAYRGLGIGRIVLERLAGHARDNGLHVLRLETGVDQGAAIALYESVGFRRIAPFPPYVEDPLTLCFEVTL